MTVYAPATLSNILLWSDCIPLYIDHISHDPSNNVGSDDLRFIPMSTCLLSLGWLEAFTMSPPSLTND